MDQIYKKYQQGDYPAAYAGARDAAAAAAGTQAQEAAYMAGMAAYQMGDYGKSEYYLNHAAQSADPAMAADARAGLGLVHLQQGQYRSAEAQLLIAAATMTGQNKANALFYAGLAQQKQGRWNDARANFTLARALSNDPDFRRRVNDYLAVTGFTLQLGAYANLTNARRAGRKIAGTAGLGPPRIVPARTSEGHKLYLVQVGQFSSYDSAAAAKARLKQVEAIIVPLTGPS